MALLQVDYSSSFYKVSMMVGGHDPRGANSPTCVHSVLALLYPRSAEAIINVGSLFFSPLFSPSWRQILLFIIPSFILFGWGPLRQTKNKNKPILSIALELTPNCADCKTRVERHGLSWKIPTTRGRRITILGLADRG